jgi:hypothetical protein
VWLLGNNIKQEPFLSMILVDCYLIMDLGQGIDDIVTGIETILTGKDLEVTAMIIKLEYVDLILFY